MRTNIRIYTLLSLLALLAGCVSAGSNNNEQIQQAKPDLHEAARLNTQMGIDYLREGRNDRAREKLQRAIKQDPDYADAHSSLGFLYSRTGQPDLARKEYLRALNVDEDNPRTHNLYGVFLCSHGEYDQAMKQFKAAADIESNDAREVALTNSGVCERKQGDLNAARQRFTKALQANGNYGPALLQMADINYREHNYGIARSFLKRYEAGSQDSAFGLQLGYRIAQALGNDAEAAAYKNKLQNAYPQAGQSAE